jgi:hypothetical protein
MGLFLPSYHFLLEKKIHAVVLKTNKAKFMMRRSSLNPARPPCSPETTILNSLGCSARVGHLYS